MVLVLFLPFLLYVFWGPFAFVYAAKAIIKRLLVQFDAPRSTLLALVILTAIFLPVSVTSKGGNIPVVYPWWLAVLGLATPAGVAFSASSFLLAVAFLPVAWWYVTREVGRLGRSA